MVSAELSHNPFLLETKARFNGRDPQVNCAISKFENQPFASWVCEVPRIFHDEMNGYGFDLFFSGTDADYLSVIQAFRDACVPEDSVRVLRKGCIQAADKKLQEVRELISWLEENPSDRLDIKLLTESRPELKDPVFPLLLMHGGDARAGFASVSVESVDSIDELIDFDLTNTPVIVFVTPEVSEKVGGEIVQLLDRQDVTRAQLFFAIHPLLDREKVMRIVSDLGVQKPKVVNSPDDPAIASFLLAHPITEYVRNSIQILSEEAGRITAELEEVRELMAQSSAAGEQEMGELDREITQLKESDERFSHLAPPEAPRGFGDAERAFRESVAKWYGRRRKIDGEIDASVAAEDLERFMRQRVSDFALNLDYLTKEARKAIENELEDAYLTASIDEAYHPECEFPIVSGFPELPDIKGKVLALKRTALVEQKNDFFGLFVGGVDESEKVLVTTYYMDVWREKVLELLDSDIYAFITSREEALKSYQQAVIEAYRKHIAELVLERRAKKEDTLAKMSDEDRNLQAENDWLVSYVDLLQEIKRG